MIFALVCFALAAMNVALIVFAGGGPISVASAIGCAFIGGFILALERGR